MSPEGIEEGAEGGAEGGAGGEERGITGGWRRRKNNWKKKGNPSMLTFLMIEIIDIKMNQGFVGPCYGM